MDRLLLYFLSACLQLRLARRCACLQFAVGSLFAVFMWTVGLLKKPEFSKDMVSAFDHGAAVSCCWRHLVGSWEHTCNFEHDCRQKALHLWQEYTLWGTS